MESKLLSLQSHDSGLVGIKEYIEMMDNILPLSSDKLRRRLFWEAERQTAGAGGPAQQIPILRLAHILVTTVFKQGVRWLLGSIMENLRHFCAYSHISFSLILGVISKIKHII